MTLQLSTAHHGALQTVAARIMETTNLETDPPRFARELLEAFITVCLRTGQDGLLQELGLSDDVEPSPELQAAVASRLGTKATFDPRGPRNAKPKQAADCVTTALGLTVTDTADPPLAIAGEVRAAIASAVSTVLNRELGVPKIREDIIAWARTRCPEEHWPVFEKMVAVLDERGVRPLKQVKVPLHVEQIVNAQLVQARAEVVTRAITAALDRALPLLAEANPEAAARIDQPISLRLTPREVAVRRATEPQASVAPESVARTLLADLSELTRLAWAAAEKTARPYGASTTFALGDVIEHPKFGRGTVVSVAISRVEVEFSTGKVALVHAKK